MNYKYNVHLLGRAPGYAVRLERHNADGVERKLLLIGVGLTRSAALALIECVEYPFCRLPPRP